MAIMLPDTDPKDIHNPGEQDMYISLRDQLPQDWVVRYDYIYTLPPEHGGWNEDGQIDFIVLAPGLGLMVLEVKSSHGWACEDGTWFRIKRNGTREKTSNPFAQAQRNKHNLAKILARELGVHKGDFPCVYGHMVVYPRARMIGMPPASQSPSIIFSRRDMEDLHQRMRNAFHAWGAAVAKPELDDEAMNRMTCVLKDDCRFITPSALDMDEAEAQISRITREQWQAFEGLMGNERVRVSGVAGSGKTLIATWTAQSLAAQGKRVLLLCYNTFLAACIRQRSEATVNLTVDSFFRLCARFCGDADIPFQPGYGAWWGDEAPTLFNNALEAFGEDGKFDVIVVDEAQDFHENWWLPTQLLLREPDNGSFFLFYDPDQAGVYGHQQNMPADNMMLYELRTNCRNTRSIAGYCGSVIDKDIPLFELSPNGEDPKIMEETRDIRRRVRRVRNVVQEWLNNDINPSRIAVLSPWRPDNEASSLRLLAEQDIAGIPVIIGEPGIQQWREGRSIMGSTLKSFKGLEADCVVVTDLPVVNSCNAFGRTDLYVCASRAKHMLVMFPQNRDARESLDAYLQRR